MDQPSSEKVPPPSYTTASAPEPHAAPGPGPGPYPPQQYPPPTSQYQSGQPYAYPPPPTGYPPQPGYGTPQYIAGTPPQQSQQQQPQVVVVGAPTPMAAQRVQSFVAHIIFSCLVFWCCNWIFGLVAFILAMVASSTAVSNPTGARRLGNASIGVSVAGIVVTVIVIIIVVALILTSAPHYDYCRYTYYGTCYRNKKYYGIHSTRYCSGIKDSDGYCYYD